MPGVMAGPMPVPSWQGIAVGIGPAEGRRAGLAAQGTEGPGGVRAVSRFAPHPTGWPPVFLARVALPDAEVVCPHREWLASRGWPGQPWYQHARSCPTGRQGHPFPKPGPSGSFVEW